MPAFDRPGTPQPQDPISAILWPEGDVRFIRVDDQHPHPAFSRVILCVQLILVKIDPNLTIKDVLGFTLDGVDYWAQFRIEARKPPSRSQLWLELWEGEEICGKSGGNAVFALDLAWDFLHDRGANQFNCELPRDFPAVCEDLKEAGRSMLWQQYREREEFAKRHRLWHPSLAVPRTCNWGIEQRKCQEWGSVVQQCPGALQQIRKIKEKRTGKV